MRDWLKVIVAILAMLLALLCMVFANRAEGGIFSPRVWTVEEVRATYNTPEKLGQFIRRQFIYVRGIGVKSAEEVIRTKEGNCISIISAVKTILEPLGYECEIVPDNRAYTYGYSHAVLQVKDGNTMWVFSGTNYKQK